MREALTEPIKVILRAVRETLDRIPPELSADIYDRGIALCGGGALLAKSRSPHPSRDTASGSGRRRSADLVVLGAGKMLSDETLLKKLSLD